MVEDGHQRVNTMDENTTAVGTGEEEEVTETNMTDLMEDIIARVQEEVVGSITRRKVTKKVAITITTTIAEEGEETFTMTTIPWMKDIAIDHLTTTTTTTTSHLTDTIVNTIITAVGTRNITESSIV